MRSGKKAPRGRRGRSEATESDGASRFNVKLMTREGLWHGQDGDTLWRKTLASTQMKNRRGAGERSGVHGANPYLTTVEGVA